MVPPGAGSARPAGDCAAEAEAGEAADRRETWGHARGPDGPTGSQARVTRASPDPAPGVGTLRPMRRGCARPACAEAATVTLSYEYGSATVWLESLTAEGHPMTHDLCERHAARTVPPRGWQLVDQRALATSLAS